MQVIQFQLGLRPIPLEGVLVSAEQLKEPEVATLVSTGFYDRLAEGRGEFLTPGEIARSSVRHTPQLFRAIWHPVRSWRPSRCTSRRSVHRYAIRACLIAA